MKLVVSDLDGTLLLKYDSVGDYTIKTIRKLIDSGVEFAVATGRGRQGVDFLIEKLQRNIYVICNNGASIYDKNGNCIYEKMISKDIAIEILKAIRSEGVYYNAFDRENFYFNKTDPRDFTGRRKSFKRVPLESEEEIPNLSKIIITDKEEIVSKMSDIMRKKYSDKIEVTISDPICVDLVPKDCSKGNGIKKIGEILGIETCEVMAFGDGENDLDMLRTVGHPVAMENSQEILKKEIKNIARPNVEEGVAKYIEEYFKF